MSFNFCSCGSACNTLSPMRCTIEHATANVLPHLHEHGLKAEYSAYMTALVLSSAGGYAKHHTHRDLQMNKRIEMPHILLMPQLRACLLKQRNNLERNVAKGMSDNKQSLWKCVQYSTPPLPSTETHSVTVLQSNNN